MGADRRQVQKSERQTLVTRSLPERSLLTWPASRSEPTGLCDTDTGCYTEAPHWWDHFCHEKLSGAR